MKNSTNMKAKQVGRWLVFSIGATLAACAHAHHSMAQYDTAQVVTVSGTVAKYEWANPHVYVYVEQVTESGSKVEWEVEILPPAVMRRQGWSKDTLRAGDTIIISGNPAKKAGSKGLYPTTIKRGQDTLFASQDMMKNLADTGAAPRASAKGLDGTWVTALSIPIIQQFLRPSAEKLTEAGVKARKSFDERTMSPVSNCVPYTSPMFMFSPDIKRIETRGNSIVIGGEFDGTQRTIHMDVATHDGALPSIQGHSIGKWEGKSLVIDTTHFAYHAMGNGSAVPSSPQKHLVERLTLSVDGKSLTYRFEHADPEFLAAPVTGELQWVFRPDLKFEPVACNLENARRFLKE
jgi:hypothetical protein